MACKFFLILYFDNQTFQETPSKKKNRMTSRVDGRRMTIMANVAARQKKADFTNLERDFKKKFQSLRKNLNLQNQSFCNKSNLKQWV